MPRLSLLLGRCKPRFTGHWQGTEGRPLGYVDRQNFIPQFGDALTLYDSQLKLGNQRLDIARVLPIFIVSVRADEDSKLESPYQHMFNSNGMQSQFSDDDPSDDGPSSMIVSLIISLAQYHVAEIED